jgi:hypothetical protein
MAKPRAKCWSKAKRPGYNPGPMKRNPFDELFYFLPDPPDERSAWLYNPLHPNTLFCVLCVVAGMLLMTLLTRGG